MAATSLRMAAVMLLPALFLSAQSTTAVKSRSNVKDNLPVSPQGKLMCRNPAGKACTAEEVKEAQAVVLKSRSNTKDNLVLSPAGPDGSLKCETADGKPCSAAQTSDLVKAFTTAKNAGDAVGGVGVGLGKKGGPRQ
jgi:hypothetical protein